MIEAPAEQTDWYYRRFVPKDPAKYVAFRRRMLEWGYASTANARELWIICSRDFLFYVNTFGWLLNPHDKPKWQKERWFGNAKRIPFRTRPDQDANFLKLLESFGKEDVVIPKSRDVGASWMVLYAIDHPWRFREHFHAGLVSKDEDAVDRPGSTSSLMYKLDFIEEHLPVFLRPDFGSPAGRIRNAASHIITNVVMRSTIEGYAAGTDVDRGGRKMVFMFDEMHAWDSPKDELVNAALQHNCPSRIFISTPSERRAQSGAFWKICTDESLKINRIEMRWEDDAEKAAGLYRFNKRTKELVILDEDYKFPIDYPFIVDGLLRSPYFDWEWGKALATPQSIAAELNRDFGSAGAGIFEPDVKDIMRETVMDCAMRAEVATDKDGNFIPKLRPAGSGDIALWRTYEVDNNGFLIIPKGKYGFGQDIAFGSGGHSSSYSANVGVDLANGEQFLEWRSREVRPDDFGILSWCIGKAFHDGLLTPENIGPQSEQFCREILNRGYPNCYQPSTADATKEARFSNKKIAGRFGYNHKDGGLKILMECAQAIRRKLLVIRSEVIFREFSRYVRDGERAKHPLIGKGNPNMEVSHGDSAIAMGVCWWGAKQEYVPPQEEQRKPLPVNGWVRRRLDYERGQANRISYWSPLESQERSRHTDTGFIDTYGTD